MKDEELLKSYETELSELIDARNEILKKIRILQRKILDLGENLPSKLL